MCHGFSPTNYGVPSELLTFTNLVSSAILDNTVPEVIVTWLATYKISTSFKHVSYQTPYRVLIIIFSLIISVLSLLTGVNVTYYYICLPILFSMWIVYLVSCCILLVYSEFLIYQLTRASITKDENNAGLVQVSILLILLDLVLCVFVPVIANFLFYAVETEMIEKSSCLPLFEWYCFKFGSSMVVTFWAGYFWINTKSEAHEVTRSRVITGITDFFLIETESE